MPKPNMRLDHQLKAQMVATLLSGIKWYKPQRWSESADDSGESNMVAAALELTELILDHVEDSYTGEPDDPEDEEVSE